MSIEGLDIEAGDDGIFLLLEGDFAEEYESYLDSAGMPHLKIALSLAPADMRNFIGKLESYYGGYG